MTRSILTGLAALALTALQGCYADVAPYAPAPVYAQPVYSGPAYVAAPAYSTAYVAPAPVAVYRPAPVYRAPYRTAVVVGPRYRRYW